MLSLFLKSRVRTKSIFRYGFGWFIDSTPEDDEEFTGGTAVVDSPAAGRMDLLTAVMHELGHSLGLEDNEPGSDVMEGLLETGTRHQWDESDLDAVFANFG